MLFGVFMRVQTLIPLLSLFAAFPLYGKLKVVPVLKADLREVGIATFAPTYRIDELTLFKKGEKPHHFKWKEIHTLPPCTGKACPKKPAKPIVTRYRVTQVSDAGCGSQRIFATEVTQANQPIVLTLLDHTTRVCDDVVVAKWEVSLAQKKKPVRLFVGDPKSLKSAPDCSKINDNMACPMLYAPITCGVNSWKGKPLTPPISVSGGNNCLTQLGIRTALCERGLDYENLENEKVMCEYRPCPMPMCAAPPEGCHTVAIPDRNAQGCLAFPCGTLECEPKCPALDCAAPPPGCKYYPDTETDSKGCPAFPCGRLACE